MTERKFSSDADMEDGAPVLALNLQMAVEKYSASLAEMVVKYKYIADRHGGNVAVVMLGKALIDEAKAYPTSAESSAYLLAVAVRLLAEASET